mgnify:FL=1
MTKPTFYITTPIYYPSAQLHIGHAYCTTIADTIARYKRANGFDVMFLTGSDEHGQKIQRKAEAEGLTPIQYTDKIVATFKNLWKMLEISNDDFVRTSEERHQKVVQAVIQKVFEQGDIYKKNYEGKYCVQCESFWTEHQLEEAGGVCPDCGRPVETMKEESYFFKLSKYEDRLLAYIESHPDFIQPVSRRNEMINFIKQGLEDLCITRSTFDWGIKVPFDPKHVVYVWFDALLNYFTGIGYGTDMEKFHKFWPCNLHLVGKEIVRFHTIIWPIMLMAIGEELPQEVYGHGWLIVDGGKMSKSKGNVVDPVALINEFGADAIRYFLLREINLGSDGNFSRDALINRINSDLANDLGNLLHRTTSMIEKYHGGIVHKVQSTDPLDVKMAGLAAETLTKYRTAMDKLSLNEAIRELWSYIGVANKYIDESAPWVLAKDPAKAERLQAVMYNLADSLRNIAIMLSPFMPGTSPRIFTQLGLTTPEQFSLEEVAWGNFPDGTKVAKGDPLYPRIEVNEKGETVIAASKKTQGAKPAAPAKAVPAPVATEGKPEITIDDFAKLDLRVATILSVEKVPKTDKLMKLQIKIGEEERTIVSGIAQYYTEEQLVGRNIIVIANLKPAKLRGIESKGMLLAASDGEGHLVLADAPGMKSGSRVK